MDESANTLTNNLVDIIDMIKLELGIMHVTIEHFNLDQLIKSIIADVSNDKITINYFITPTTPPLISTDKKKTKQLLYNLLNNAFKHTIEGEISLYVDCTRVDDDEQQEDKSTHVLSTRSISNTSTGVKLEVNFIIKDTGKGMDKITKYTLFKPVDFFNKQKGITMRINYLLAILLSGSLKLVYSEDTGSCFQLAIIANIYTECLDNKLLSLPRPLISQPRPSSPRPLISQPRPSSPRPSPQPYILIVEDDPIGRVVLRELLNQKKFINIDSSINGYEAFKLIKANLLKYTIVITDIQMPKLNGIELSEKINELYKGLKIKKPYVLGMTARILKKEDLNKFDDLITKPLNIEVIVKKIMLLCL